MSLDSAIFSDTLFRKEAGPAMVGGFDRLNHRGMISESY